MKEKDIIRYELSRILDSRLFEGKKQVSNFLSYTVNETLDGRGEKLTQYAIAIEALGKPHDYCPTESPAVRVEAGRVRKLLEEFYASEGHDSRIRIHLPVGSYQPEFEVLEPVQNPVMQGFGLKSIQSQGPKIYIHCQNPGIVRDDELRTLLYSVRSTAPTVLGQFREIRIALALPAQAGISLEEAMEFAWKHQQAEFLLQCMVDRQRNGYSLRFAVFHTLTRGMIWSETLVLPHAYNQQMLETAFGQVVLEAFSLHRGTALLFWSGYWKVQDNIPGHYRVLVEHVDFIHEQVGKADIRPFLEACRTRTQCYHDDAMAHLHFAVLCLYAYMLGLDIDASLETFWNRLAVRALELNPGNALAHVIYALECFHRGDTEMGEVEMETARYVNPHDCAGGHLLAVGLCALGYWERAFVTLRDVAGLHSSYPDPLRTIPCLFYFKRGEYIRLAKANSGCHPVGGWEAFGKMATHCRMDDCKSCIQEISRSVDGARSQSVGQLQSARDVWESIQQRLINPPLSNACSGEKGGSIY